MSRRTVSILISALGLAVAAACASNAPSGAGLAAWNQAGVSGLAGQLSTAADAWELAVRQANPDRLGAGSAEEGMGLVEKARRVSEQSRSLSGHLKAGQGRDQTYNSFRSLKEQVDDAEVEQARTALDQPVNAAWTQFKGLFDQIKPYYEP